jgi:tetratricopeptide (TPR) repeat protein
MLGKKLGLALAAATMMTSATTAEWIRAETDNFVVFSELKKKDVKQFLENLEQYRNYLSKITKVPPEGGNVRLRIFVAKTPRKYDSLVEVPGTAGLHSNTELGPTAAIYFTEEESKKRGRKGSIRNRLDKQIIGQTGKQVLFHEFVHNMQYQGPPAYFPLWYQEGFAEFLSSVHFTDDQMFFGKVLIGRAFGLQQHHRWVSAKELLERKRYGFKGGMFYAQAWLLTHMLFLDKDFQHGVGDFIKLVQHEIHPEKALQHVYGIGYEELDKRMHAYYRKNEYGVLGMPLDKSFKAKVEITKLNDREQELVEQEVGRRLVHDEGRMKSYAKRAERAVKKYGASPEFSRNHALALAYADEWAQAFEVAEKAVQQFPDSMIPKATLGKLLVGSELYAEFKAEEEADKKKDKKAKEDDGVEAKPVYDFNKETLRKGAELLKEAAEAMPRDPEIFSMLGRALMETDQVSKENTRYIKHAYDIYPQSNSVRRLYGDFLVEDDDFELACEVLRPLYHTSNSLKDTKELRNIILEFPDSEEVCPLGGLRPIEMEAMEEEKEIE